ncbi:SRPBCC family protein [Pseudonocardia nematodicida]|uniref:SRPBCC family protein n=1 Tax=Pseudonocardia nematodicida TaxID=1206997 RepID=A0ABV1KAR2_9PSEU
MTSSAGRADSEAGGPAGERVELTVPVEVAVPADVLWRGVTDWEGQSEWMLGTQVQVTGGDGRSVGTELRAVTGIGPLGVADTMRITGWTEPPSGAGGERRVVVVHTGRVIRGEGVFAVEELGPRRSRFLWSELLDLPFGTLGRLGWPLVRPAFAAGVTWSLRRMATRTEDRWRAGR